MKVSAVLLPAFFLLSFCCVSAICYADSDKQPNIVVIISEDMGPDLGCWGTNVRTPNLDRLASEGMRFTHLFGTASVCMPNRTAMITGITQSSLGAVTMRPPKKFMRPLPDGVKPVPALLREVGYQTGNIKSDQFHTNGKDDWNFIFENKSWDTKQLDSVDTDKPFYLQFNIFQAHRPYVQDKQHPVDPETVIVPPYYPDHPVMRKSWSDYLESIQDLDKSVGKILSWLDKSNQSDNTIVFFLSDHGEAFLRGKYFLYDCSLNQPLIIRWPTGCSPPAGYDAGITSNKMLASIDIAAQTLQCAGVKQPSWMHGKEFLSTQESTRNEVFSAADWYGGAKLKSRSIRTDRYKYIRNFKTDISVQSVSSEYRKALHPLYHLAEILEKREELNTIHRQLLLDPLPNEELYDLEADPHEMNNLVGQAEFAEVHGELKERLTNWIKESGDLGFEPLSPEHAEHFDNYRETQEKNNRKRRNALRLKVLDAVEAEATRRKMATQ